MGIEENKTQPAVNSLDAIELAWGIIANAGGGNWGKETPEWQDAAVRWRDTYLPQMGAKLSVRAKTGQVVEYDEDLGPLIRAEGYNAGWEARKQWEADRKMHAHSHYDTGYDAGFKAGRDSGLRTAETDKQTAYDNGFAAGAIKALETRASQHLRN